MSQNVSRSRSTKLIFFSVITLLVTLLIAGCKQTPRTSTKSSLIQKIKSQHVLRCGYVEWAKLVEHDPKTKQVVGIFPEYMAALGNALDFKVEWGPETSFQDMIQAITSGKVDAICSGVWASGVRALHVTFTQPVAYSPVFAYVRADDHRFDKDLSLAKSADITIATTDGEMSAIIRDRRFPNSLAHALPKLSEGQQLLYAVATGKADLTFSDPSNNESFEKGNPGKIKTAYGNRPIAAFGMTIVLPMGDWETKELFDVTTRELQLSGEIDAILDKYQTVQNEFLRSGSPFNVPRN